MKTPCAPSRELILLGSCGSTHILGEVVHYPRSNIASIYTRVSFLRRCPPKAMADISHCPKEPWRVEEFGCLYCSRMLCWSHLPCTEEQYTSIPHLIISLHYTRMKPRAPSPSRDTIVVPPIPSTSPPDRSNTSTRDSPTPPRVAVTGIEPMFATRTSVVEWDSSFKVQAPISRLEALVVGRVNVTVCRR